jgi:hypothetical protein
MTSIQEGKDYAGQRVASLAGVSVFDFMRAARRCAVVGESVADIDAEALR